jgi:hypothetical protein
MSQRTAANHYATSPPQPSAPPIPAAASPELSSSLTGRSSPQPPRRVSTWAAPEAKAAFPAFPAALGPAVVADVVHGAAARGGVGAHRRSAPQHRLAPSPWPCDHSPQSRAALFSQTIYTYIHTYMYISDLSYIYIYIYIQIWNLSGSVFSLVMCEFSLVCTYQIYHIFTYTYTYKYEI